MFFPNYLASLHLQTSRFFVTVRTYRVLSAHDNDVCFNVGDSLPAFFVMHNYNQ